MTIDSLKTFDSLSTKDNGTLENQIMGKVPPKHTLVS